MALTTNLVAYYKFDADNSNDAVSTNNGTDSIMSYSAAAGKIGHGASFNGTSSAIALPSGIYSLFNGTSNWTINLWVNVQVLPSGDNINVITVVDSPANNFQHQSVDLQVTDVGLSVRKFSAFRGDGGAVDAITGSTVLSASTFYMVSLVFNGTTLSLYVNGASDATPVASTRTATTGGSGYLGRENDASSTAKWWNGYMDEVGFWSRALSGAEITQLYNGGAGLQYPFTAASAARRTLMGAGA